MVHLNSHLSVFPQNNNHWVLFILQLMHQWVVLKTICAKTCLTELLLRKHYDMVESSHWSRWNTDQAGKWWCSVYGQDARCTAVKAVVIKGNVKVGTHEVTLKRILGIETNTAGMSRKWAGSPPQNGVRWQWFEETFPSTYKLQY